MLMAIFMKVNGKTIKPMVMASILILMVLDTKVNGEKTNSMARELRDGLTVLATKAITSKVRSTDKASSFGLTTVLSLESSEITTLKALVSMNGLTEEYITVNGKTIKCKVMELLPGQMAENMLESTMMI
jgi:hypothetical protein